MSIPRIAVLGAGIMGCSTALFLARRGASVTLFDAAPAPFTGASRWNEGKIHLGFIYSADPSFRTADHVIPGGLRFRADVEDLLSQDIGAAITHADDVFLCHRDSVVPLENMLAYARAVCSRLRTHPDAALYLSDASACSVHALTAAELREASGNPAIVGGVRVPERSVQTQWLADRFVAAVEAHPRIEQRMGARVLAARPVKGDVEGPWRIETPDGQAHGEFDRVVNALWEGRLAVDLASGLALRGIWSHRYRQSLFVHTRKAIPAACAVIATGPFGDVKNYNGRDFYLSWYPDGLRVDSSEVAPPPVEFPDPAQLSASIFKNLEALLPWVARIRESAGTVTVGGGWVFAAGRGSLADPGSSLHRRSDYGAVRVGNYVSVDTGKYSTAPWAARRLAASLF